MRISSFLKSPFRIAAIAAALDALCAVLALTQWTTWPISWVAWHGPLYSWYFRFFNPLGDPDGGFLQVINPFRPDQADALNAGFPLALFPLYTFTILASLHGSLLWLSKRLRLLDMPWSRADLVMFQRALKQEGNPFVPTVPTALSVFGRRAAMAALGRLSDAVKQFDGDWRRLLETRNQLLQWLPYFQQDSDFLCVLGEATAALERSGSDEPDDGALSFARYLLQGALKRHPSHIGAREALLEWHLLNPEQEAALLKECSALDPSNATFKKWELYRRLDQDPEGESARALAVLQKSYGYAADATLKRAEILLRQGQTDQALAMCRDALRLRPRDRIVVKELKRLGSAMHDSAFLQELHGVEAELAPRRPDPSTWVWRIWDLDDAAGKAPGGASMPPWLETAALLALPLLLALTLQVVRSLEQVDGVPLARHRVQALGSISGIWGAVGIGRDDGAAWFFKGEHPPFETCLASESDECNCALSLRAGNGLSQLQFRGDGSVDVVPSSSECRPFETGRLSCAVSELSATFSAGNTTCATAVMVDGRLWYRPNGATLWRILQESEDHRSDVDRSRSSEDEGDPNNDVLVLRTGTPYRIIIRNGRFVGHAPDAPMDCPTHRYTMWNQPNPPFGPQFKFDAVTLPGRLE